MRIMICSDEKGNLLEKRFEECSTFVMVKMERGEVLSRESISSQDLQALLEQGDVFVSRSMEDSTYEEIKGMEKHPVVTGLENIDDVLESYIAGKLLDRKEE